MTMMHVPDPGQVRISGLWGTTYRCCREITDADILNFDRYRFGVRLKLLLTLYGLGHLFTMLFAELGGLPGRVELGFDLVGGVFAHLLRGAAFLWVITTV